MPEPTPTPLWASSFYIWSTRVDHETVQAKDVTGGCHPRSRSAPCSHSAEASNERLLSPSQVSEYISPGSKRLAAIRLQLSGFTVTSRT